MGASGQGVTSRIVIYSQLNIPEYLGCVGQYSSLDHNPGMAFKELQFSLLYHLAAPCLQFSACIPLPNGVHFATHRPLPMDQNSAHCQWPNAADCAVQTCR